MEVCGGHTHSIYKYGIDDLLPDNVELVHGPGCPVCVMPMGRVDDGIAIAHEPSVIFTCFGDMMRVPGSHGSLLDAKAQGADVRMVYSPLDALRDRQAQPRARGRVLRDRLRDHRSVHGADAQARQGRGRSRTSRACATTSRSCRRCARCWSRRTCEIDGFIGPGHVSTVVGARPFQFIPADYAKPVVISGFEPLDVLQSIHMLLAQLAAGRCEVENQYGRVVPWEGNLRALAVMAEVFELRPHFEWRGLGFISQSGLRLSDAYAELDAERRFSVPGVRVADPKACQCGEVLKGVIKPWECKVFGTACTPERPIGTCMVSSEGACAAYYNFGRHGRPRARPARCERDGVSSASAPGADPGDHQPTRAKPARFRDERITMAHGAGGKATQTLIEGLLLPALRNDALAASPTRGRCR